jgi:hypothetical protein
MLKNIGEGVGIKKIAAKFVPFEPKIDTIWLT